jgi:hypothetical protein
VNGADVLIRIDGDVVGSQRDVTFEESTGEVDVSSKASRAKRVIAGRYEAAVSLEALYVPSDTAYQALKTAMRAGTLVTVIRQEDGATLESAEALVVKMSEKAPDQDAATVSIDLTIDGEWTAGS